MIVRLSIFSHTFDGGRCLFIGEAASKLFELQGSSATARKQFKMSAEPDGLAVYC